MHKTLFPEKWAGGKDLRQSQIAPRHRCPALRTRNTHKKEREKERETEREKEREILAFTNIYVCK